MRCAAGAAFGFTTETTGTLSDSVWVRSAACAFSRGRIPTARASSTSTSGVKRSSLVFKDRRVPVGSPASPVAVALRSFMSSPLTGLSFTSLSFMISLPLICGQGGRRGRMRLAALEPSVDRRKDDRHEQQGGHGSEQEAADHGAPEGSVLLAAVAQP